MKVNKIIAILFCIYVICSNTANGADYYIKSKATVPAGAVSGAGSSWDNAILDDPAVAGSELKALIENAVAGDNIYIAAGTYNFIGTGAIPAHFFPLKKDVKIYGGYPAGSTGTTLSGRNNTATILSGYYTASAKVRHVVYNGGTGDIGGALYDGLVIQDGGTDIAPNNFGGGVFIENVTSAGTEQVLNNVTIKNCQSYSGGGLAVKNPVNTNLTTVPLIKIENVKVDACTTNQGEVYAYGGGIYVTMAKVSLKNIEITNCWGYRGGGMAIGDRDATYRAIVTIMENITLTGNITNVDGGGMFMRDAAVDTIQNIIARSNNSLTGQGGGIAIFDSDINVMSNITMEYNWTGSGTPPYQYGGAEWDGTGSPGMNLSGGDRGGGMLMQMTRVENKMELIKARKNTSNAYGGGICIISSVTDIDSLVLENNIARLPGGGMYVDGDLGFGSRLKETSLVIDSNINVIGNYAGGNGGGLYITTMYEQNSTFYEKGPIIRDLILDGNRTHDNGGGMYLTSVTDGLVENVIIRNNIAGYMRNGGDIGHGGGTYNTTFNGTYRGVNIYGNQARVNGGGMYNTTAVMFISDFCVNHNRASAGGGMYNTTFTGNIDQALLTVARGQVNNNIAHGATNNPVYLENRGCGGGMVNTTGNYELKNVEVVSNYALNNGGGIFNTTAHWQKFYNMLIADNYSGGIGGGIYNTTCHNMRSILGSYSVGDGTPPAYTNLTVTGNYAAGNTVGKSGGGIANVFATKLILNNCILYNNLGSTSPLPTLIPSDISIHETDAHINGSRDTKAFNTIIGAAEFKNLLDAQPGRLEMTRPGWYAVVDPLFMDMPDPASLAGMAFSYGTGSTDQEQSANGSMNFMAVRGNYRLQETSPGVDGGDNAIVNIHPVPEDSLDFDKEPRFQQGINTNPGKIIDLGPYEGYGGNNYDYPCFGCAPLPPQPPLPGEEPFFRWWYISSPYKNANPRTFDIPGGTLGSASGSMLGYYSEQEKRYTEPFVATATPGKHFFPADRYFTPGRGIAASLDTATTQFCLPDSLTFIDMYERFKNNIYGRVENDPVVQIKVYNTDTVPGRSGKKGMNLLGNPFLSNLDLYKFYEDNMDSIASTVWIRGWNRSANKMIYDTYNILDGEGTDSIVAGKPLDRVLPPIQGFWVRALKDSATIIFKRPDHLATDQSPRPLRLPAATGNRTMRLTVTSGNISDQALVIFNHRAKTGYDNYDSDKISNDDPGIPEVYTKTDGREVTINGMPYPQNEITEIPLGFRTGQSGKFTISGRFGNWNDARVILVDKTSDMATDLTAGETFTFQSNIYSSSNRFALKIIGMVNATETPEYDNILIYANAANRIAVQSDQKVQCAIYTVLGQKLAEETLASGTNTLNYRLNAGIYIVKAGNKTERVVIK